MRPQTLGLTFLLLVQVLSVSARGLSAETLAPQKIQFHTTFYPDVHEGYASLQWNDVLDHRTPGSLYHVYDQDHSTIYRGSLPMAFVSGLADGEHQFHVAAMDADGNVLARSAEPARVVVEHWSLFHAMLLFGIGLTVFVALIAVMVHGGVRGHRELRDHSQRELNT